MKIGEHRYARQKLCEALDILVGSGPIEERLTHVVRPLRQLQPDQIPPLITEELHAVLGTLTKTPLVSSDGSDYLPRQVTPEEGAKLARRIFSMFVQLLGGL
jgi:hypothetical protein